MNINKLRGAIVTEYKTQNVFADEIGWHKNRVSKMMNGKYVPDINEVARMAKALRLDDRQFKDIFLA